MSAVVVALVLVGPGSLLLATTPVHAQEKGFYFGGDLGLVIGGNVRSNGFFESTGTVFDGQLLGTLPENAVKGKFDSGLTTGVIGGYAWKKKRFGRFRLEGELFYQDADTDKFVGELDGSELDPPGRVDTTSLGLVGNFVYDFPDLGSVTPYIAVGVGHAKTETKYDFPGRGQVGIDGFGRVLQAGLGVDIPLKKRVSLDVKYRFRRALLNEKGQDTDIDARILQVGVRYAF